MQNLYKWKHFSEEIIVQSVYWYLKYSLSYRDVQELLSERGIKVCYTTIYKWIIQYSPIVSSRIKKKLIKLMILGVLMKLMLKLMGSGLIFTGLLILMEKLLILC